MRNLKWKIDETGDSNLNFAVIVLKYPVVRKNFNKRWSVPFPHKRAQMMQQNGCQGFRLSLLAPFMLHELKMASFTWSLSLTETETVKEIITVSSVGEKKSNTPYTCLCFAHADINSRHWSLDWEAPYFPASPKQTRKAALWSNHNAVTCFSVLAVRHRHERADRVWFAGTCGPGCCLSLELVCCYRGFDCWEGPIWCKRRLKFSLGLLWNDE